VLLSRLLFDVVKDRKPDRACGITEPAAWLQPRARSSEPSRALLPYWGRRPIDCKVIAGQAAQRELRGAAYWRQTGERFALHRPEYFIPESLVPFLISLAFLFAL